MAKKNRYINKARKTQFLQILKGNVNPKGNKGATAIITLKDLVIAVVAGRLVAVNTGGFSVPIGAVITAAGHFWGNQHLQALGIGTMAASNQRKSDTVNGIEGLDGIKERMKAYKESLLDDLFIKKLLKKTGVNGFGEVQYFNYPDTSVGELAALDNIENQLVESGMQFQGADDYMNGMDGMDDPLY